MQKPRDVIFQKRARAAEDYAKVRLEAIRQENIALRLALTSALPWVKRHIDQKAARSAHQLIRAALSQECA